jgi:hypothetical protein
MDHHFVSNLRPGASCTTLGHSTAETGLSKYAGSGKEIVLVLFCGDSPDAESPAGSGRCRLLQMLEEQVHLLLGAEICSIRGAFESVSQVGEAALIADMLDPRLSGRRHNSLIGIYSPASSAGLS